MIMIGKKQNTVLRILLLSLVCLLSVNGFVMAEDSIVIIEVENTEPEMGMSFKVDIIINSEEQFDAVYLDGIDEFELVSTSQSSKTQILNGETTHQKIVSLELTPKYIGEVSLKSKVKYGDGLIESNTITVTVVESVIDQSEKKDEVFITSEMSSDTIYFGEKVHITYNLYTSLNFDARGFTEEVNFDDFIVREENKENLTSNYTTINGVKYIRYEIKKAVLTPTRLGEYIIPAFDYQVNISSNNYYSAATPRYLETEEKKLTVLELPKENRPENFNGLIGNLKFTYNYDKKETEINEAITLNILIEGHGNLGVLDELFVDDINGFSVYETETEVEESIVSGEYFAKKSYEIILVATESGDLIIDPLSFDYFDTVEGKYMTFEIPEQKVVVTGEDKAIVTNTSLEKILITQIKIENDKYFNLRLHKNAVYLVTSLVTVIVLLFIFRKKVRFKSKKPKYLRIFEKELRSSKTSKLLYDKFSDFLLSQYSLRLKSSSSETIEKVTTNYGVTQDVLEIVNHMEHERFYKEEELSVMFKKMIYIVNKMHEHKMNNTNS